MNTPLKSLPAHNRQVIFDTETTGLDPAQGHRVIEIGCVELVNRRIGGTFHRYLNPEREIDAGAQAVHGLSNAFLADKPRFAQVVEELIAFLHGAELIAHNLSFDQGFLDHELALAGRPERLQELSAQLTDTLPLARRLHPGQRNSLDALCKRYGVDASRRERHGALLDAELLAEVYLAMTGGQGSMGFDLQAEPGAVALPGRLSAPGAAITSPGRVLAADAGERAAHEAWLERLDAAAKGPCLWRQLGL